MKEIKELLYEGFRHAKQNTIGGMGNWGKFRKRWQVSNSMVIPNYCFKTCVKSSYYICPHKKKNWEINEIPMKRDIKWLNLVYTPKIKKKKCLFGLHQNWKIQWDNEQVENHLFCIQYARLFHKNI